MTTCPRLTLLSEEEFELVHQSSLKVLEKIGVRLDNEEALTMLQEGGAEAERERKVVRIPPSLVEDSLKRAPSTVKIYGRDKKYDLTLGERNVTFNPGSTAIHILDWRTGSMRKPTSRDLEDFVRLADALSNIHAQSTALVVSDVPEVVADLYRLYIALKNSAKPVVTGAFSVEGLHNMKRLLDVVSIEDKPTAVFDVCPSPPLMWSYTSSRNLVDCAKLGLPVEIIPMPQSGATAPATLAGTLVQHNAEFLSGLTICELARSGAPVIYGGSPSIFDMRYCTAPLSAIEAVMLTCAYAQVGRRYNLPTHAYLGLSDAKLLDAQAGLESGVGLILGAQAGINVVAGPGMLGFESCQSFEKLVVDNEVCSMALRLVRGIEVNEETLALDILERVKPGGHFLTQKHTLEWFRREHLSPSPIIDRLTIKRWVEHGSKDVTRRAREEVERILREHKPQPLESEVERELERELKRILERYRIAKP